MTLRKGRVIFHQAMDPVFNMAVDEALARACDEGGPGFPLIRFYWWSVPTLSLGAKERLEEAADQQACEELGISLVRRPTGGRSVLHFHEVTYAIIAPIGIQPFQSSVEHSYRLIAEAQARGLKALGIELQLTPGGRKVRPRTAGGDSAPAPGGHLPCFAAPSRYELTWRGRKVVGSAQRRLRNAVLQHGSILLSSDIERLSKATRAGKDGPERLAKLVAGLEEIAGRAVERQEIITAMLPELKAVFDVEFDESELTTEEERRVDELIPVTAARL